MIGMIGRKKGSDRTVEYNRLAHPTEAVSQCLTFREISLLKTVLDGQAKLSDEVWQSFQDHIEGCCDCQTMAANELGFHRAVVRMIGLGDDSLHTSAPPEKICSVFCKTHRVTRNPNMTDFKEEIVH